MAAFGGRLGFRSHAALCYHNVESILLLPCRNGGVGSAIPLDDTCDVGSHDKRFPPRDGGTAERMECSDQTTTVGKPFTPNGTWRATQRLLHDGWHSAELRRVSLTKFVGGCNAPHR